MITLTALRVLKANVIAKVYGDSAIFAESLKKEGKVAFLVGQNGVFGSFSG